MRYKKFIMIIFICMLIAFIWIEVDLYYGITGPPAQNKTVTDPAEYGRYNSYVRDFMGREYRLYMPEQIPENCEAEYYYRYLCGVFDDCPETIVYLKTTYNDAMDFTAEQERLLEFNYLQELGFGSKSYILFHEPSYIERYMSGEDYEYTGLNLCVAVIDEDEASVEYLSAYIYQSWIRPEQVTHIAEPVWKLLNGEAG